LDDLDAAYSSEAAERSCSVCSGLTQRLRAITIHRSDKNVVDPGEKKVNAEKTKQRKDLHEQLTSHLQQDRSHPTVVLEMPRASPLPQQPLSSLLTPETVTQAEIDRIQLGMRWVSNAKQVQYNDALLNSDENGLNVCIRAMQTALQGLQVRLRTIQADREQRQRVKEQEEIHDRLVQRELALTDLNAALSASVTAKKATHAALLQEDQPSTLSLNCPTQTTTPTLHPQLAQITPPIHGRKRNVPPGENSNPTSSKASKPTTSKAQDANCSWKWGCKKGGTKTRAPATPCPRPDDEDGALWVQCDSCAQFWHAKHAMVAEEAQHAADANLDFPWLCWTCRPSR